MSTPPLRVLVLTHVFPRAPDDPAAPFLLRYVQGLVGAGAEVRVLAPHDAGLPTEHQVAGVPVRRVRYGSDRREDLAYRGEMHLRVRRPGGAVAALRLVRALARAVREEVATWRPDVLDVHWLVPGAVAARLARPPVPVQLVVHGTDLALVSPGPVRRGAARLLVRSVDVLAAASGPLAAEVAAVLRRPADAVVTMPFDPPRAQPRPPPAADAVLAVGRLVPEKGLLDLVEAVARVRRGGRAVALTIVGEGPQRPRLEAAARTLRVPVDLPGALPPSDLDAAYGAADLVVVPSHREGFGLVAVEALARFRPVVATTVGGLAEIVRDGTTGWAVPPGDVPALARAIEAALADPEEALRRARTGADHVTARWSAQQLGRESVARFRALARPD